jgi:hypothetical protein
MPILYPWLCKVACNWFYSANSSVCFSLLVLVLSWYSPGKEKSWVLGPFGYNYLLCPFFLIFQPPPPQGLIDFISWWNSHQKKCLPGMLCIEKNSGTLSRQKRVLLSIGNVCHGSWGHIWAEGTFELWHLPFLTQTKLPWNFKPSLNQEKRQSGVQRHSQPFPHVSTQSEASCFGPLVTERLGSAPSPSPPASFVAAQPQLYISVTIKQLWQPGASDSHL